MRLPRLLLVLVVVPLLAACNDDGGGGGGASTTTSRQATATTVDADAEAKPPDADVKLITQLWADKSAAYEQGPDRVAQFIFENNYPELQATETLEKCRQALGDLPEGYREDNVVAVDTIRRDDEWNPEIGNVQTPPRGRVYVMTLTITVTTPGQPLKQQTGGAHVTVLDDRAYFFFPCAS